ncbi:MAG: hypothetical protein LUH20_03910 [Lachnospiraceae bacterium]|nr:hypothetical protein [Lachnospiraceae bacterium]
MATSSIFANVKITDPKKAEIFIEALDASARESKREPSAPDIPILSEAEDIRKLMAKRFPNI